MARDTVQERAGSAAEAWYRRAPDAESLPGPVHVTGNGVGAPEQAAAEPFRSLLVAPRLNDVPHLNDFLRRSHARLPAGGLMLVRAQTLSARIRELRSRHSAVVATVIHAAEFVRWRVLPRIAPTRAFFRRRGAGRWKVLTQTETLGRLVYCGFEIVERREVEDELHVLCRRADREPGAGDPSYGVFFVVNRMGEGGQPIRVYKIRTMHPYAEFIHQDILVHGRLTPMGKPHADFRVTAWGRWLRRVWIDELPMLLNWVRGDMKLIGIRPISEHYARLLPEAHVARRSLFKPGLIPPLYADGASSFDEVVASESRYLDRYEREPFRTDVRYFFRFLHNVLLKGMRSE